MRYYNLHNNQTYDDNVRSLQESCKRRDRILVCTNHLEQMIVKMRGAEPKCTGGIKMERDQEMEQIKTRLEAVEAKLELLQNQIHSYGRQYSNQYPPQSKTTGGIFLYIILVLFVILAIIGILQFIGGGS